MQRYEFPWIIQHHNNRRLRYSRGEQCSNRVKRRENWDKSGIPTLSAIAEIDKSDVSKSVCARWIRFSRIYSQGGNPITRLNTFEKWSGVRHARVAKSVTKIRSPKCWWIYWITVSIFSQEWVRSTPERLSAVINRENSCRSIPLLSNSLTGLVSGKTSLHLNRFFWLS